MMRKRYTLLLLLLGAMLVSSVLAQETTPEATPESSAEATAEMTTEATAESTSAVDDACPIIVRDALDLTAQRCNGTNINEACYGHILLDAQPRSQSTTFDFSDPGDIIDLIQVESLQLSALDRQLGQWGVMLMEVAANVEGEIRPEDVQLLLFGDTELSDTVDFVDITADDDIAIRATPSPDADDISTLDAGESILANARTPDGDWLRVRFSSERGALGWIARDAISTTGDLDALPELTGDTDPNDLAATYGPMQAFRFRSGTNDAPCEQAPNSGMLIQTPEGEAAVTLLLDEVVVQLQGSSFVQAEPNGDLSVNVLEGSAQVESDGETRTALSGSAIDVPLNDEGLADGVPSAPRPIDADDVQELPVTLLDDDVEVPQPRQLAAGEPYAGTYSFSWGVDALTCEDGTEVPFVSQGGGVVINVQEDSLTVGNLGYNEVNTGVYRTTYTDAQGSLHQDTLQVVGADLLSGTKVLDLADPICTLTVPFSYSLVSASE